jgi:small subunit ribosomal protein S3Ae
MAADKKTALVKKKKKRWFPLMAPAFLGDRIIGETTAYETTELPGRSVSVSVANLLGDMKKQGVYLRFKVIEVKEGKCQVRMDRYEMSPGSIKRLVKRGRTKISDSFVCKTQDEVFVRIKPLLITNTLAKRALGTKLRKGARMFFKEYCHATSFEDIVSDLIKGNTQKMMRDKLSKLYPLRIADVYMLERETKNLRESVDEKGTDIVFDKPTDEDYAEEEPVESEKETSEQDSEDESGKDAEESEEEER